MKSQKFIQTRSYVPWIQSATLELTSRTLETGQSPSFPGSIILTTEILPRPPVLAHTTEGGNVQHTPQPGCRRPMYATSDRTATMHTPTASITTGALEYSTYLARQFPVLATHPLTLMLKELNAKALLHIHNTRVSVLNDMFSFTEKLMAHLSTQCICCNARGFSDFPLNAQITTDDALERTPVNAKLSGVRLDMSDNEGSTSRQSAGASKRPHLAPDSDTISKKKKASDVRGESSHSNLCRSSDNIIEQAVCIFNQIASNYNSDEDDPNGPAVFGKLIKVLPKRHPIFHYSYAANPRRDGRAPPPLKPDIADELAKALMQIPSEELERYWIVHDTPRLVCVRGHALREQLAGDGNVEHELMCVALRRYSQVDSEVDQRCPYLN